MRRKIVLLIICLTGHGLTSALALSEPIKTQLFPQEYWGMFSDQKIGCPVNDGLMIVESDAYTTYMRRDSNNSEYEVDTHECKIISIKKLSKGHQLKLSCVSIFEDLNRLRVESATERWRLNSSGHIVVDGQTIYRRCY